MKITLVVDVELEKVSGPDVDARTLADEVIYLMQDNMVVEVIIEEDGDDKEAHYEITSTSYAVRGDV